MIIEEVNMSPANKQKTYILMGEPFGIHKVRHNMEWGKKKLVDFLNKLSQEWGRNPYWQYDEYGNWADIPLGDISRKGGGPKRSKVKKFGGHGSHRCGWDVDLYYIAKDGVPRESADYRYEKIFDLERTNLLGKAILKHGGTNLEKIFVGGQNVVNFMYEEAAKMGLSQIIDNDSSGMHHNHFHVRFKNLDKDLMCVM